MRSFANGSKKLTLHNGFGPLTKVWVPEARCNEGGDDINHECLRSQKKKSLSSRVLQPRVHTQARAAGAVPHSSCGFHLEYACEGDPYQDGNQQHVHDLQRIKLNGYGCLSMQGAQASSNNTMWYVNAGSMH